MQSFLKDSAFCGKFSASPGPDVSGSYGLQCTLSQAQHFSQLAAASPKEVAWMAEKGMSLFGLFSS